MPDGPHRSPRPRHIAVVGGGWAGCAAAVTLAQASIPVALFEQARTLGGRARRVTLDGIVVDNGQHLLVGAYRRTLELVALVHGREAVAELFHRLPLTLQPFGKRRTDDVSLAAWRAPAPLNLAGALLTARGLSWRDRWALVAGFRELTRAAFRCPSTQTVAECFARAPRSVFDALWEPLCLAALNTPPERASAQAFAQVLRETFAGSAQSSDFVVPAADLSACFPDAAARFVTTRGGNVHCGVAVQGIEARERGVSVCTGAASDEYAAAIVAVAPHQLRRTIGPAAATIEGWRETLALVAAFTYESITTVYLRFAAPLPMRVPLLRLDDDPGQWIFRHRARASTSPNDADANLYSVVISAGGPHDTAEHAALAREVESQLRRLDADLPPVLWSRVIAERRATYACTPRLLRPSPGRIARHVYLAGDYTDPDLPATIEAATRSGVAAARALIADLDAGTGYRGAC